MYNVLLGWVIFSTTVNITIEVLLLRKRAKNLKDIFNYLGKEIEVLSSKGYQEREDPNHYLRFSYIEYSKVIVHSTEDLNNKKKNTKRLLLGIFVPFIRLSDLRISFEDSKIIQNLNLKIKEAAELLKVDLTNFK